MAGIKGILLYEVKKQIFMESILNLDDDCMSLLHLRNDSCYLQIYFRLFSLYFFSNFIYFIFMYHYILGTITGLVSLAFAGSIGMTFVILACALPQYEKQWWPFFVVLFYVLCPIPTMIARRHTDSTGGGNSPCMETAVFITMGLIVSSFALPIVIARSLVIQWTACYLTLAGNVIVYLTILGFFTIFDMDDSDYTMW